MLERDKGPTKEFAFLIAVPLQPHITPESVMLKIADALMWVEGTGKCEMENLGVIDTYDEPTTVMEEDGI